MAITIKIGEEAKPEKVFVLDLNAKRSPAGDILIFDHDDFDIIIQQKPFTRILTIPKGRNSEAVYQSSDRLFKFLLKRGMIKPDSVQGGSIYGSLEAIFKPSDKDYNMENLFLLNIHDWIQEERPYIEIAQELEDLTQNALINPDEEHSTELGEVPQETTKGTLRPGYNYGPYWQAYTYEE